MFTDLRHAFRSLARNRGFSLVTVLTLGLGIGSAASIFSVADWVLFRANKFPDNVYLIGGHSSRNPASPFRYDFMAQAYQDQVRAMTNYALAMYQTGNVAISNQPIASSWIDVSPNLFQLLEIIPAQGRAFLSSGDTASFEHVVVVSHQFWKHQLGRRGDVLGSKLIVGGTVCTVVGVLGQGQAMPDYISSDIYHLLVFRAGPPQPMSPQLFVFGRLRSGVTRDQAEQALGAAKFDFPVQLKYQLSDDRPVLSSLVIAGGPRIEVFWVMSAAVGFLYAIAWLNASNLSLVRLFGQRRELSVRLALGGSRWRIIRLIAVESATLAMLGSLVGLLVTNWLFPLLFGAAGASLGDAQWTSWSVSWRMAGLMALLTVATYLFILALPALRLFRADIVGDLKDGGGATVGESRALARLRGLFVMLQAAFAVILLTGAGLMIRTFHQLQKVELGFDSAGRVKLSIRFPADYPNGQELRLSRLREVQAELQRLPGVEAAAFGSDVLLPGYFFPSLMLDGSEGKPIPAAMNIIQIGYQEVAGLRLKRGRWLSHPTSTEILVGEAFARQRWPDTEPIGQFVKPVGASSSGGKGWLVVGVVGDVRSTMRNAPGPAIYGSEMLGAATMDTFILKLSRDYDETFASTIRRKLYEFDPRIVVRRIMPVAQLQESQLWLERTTNSVLKVLAGIALLLTVVGIFSMLAYTVSRRMGEFGVRMALGATRRDLVQLVMQRSVLLTSLGVLAGLCCALMLTRFLRSQLFETSQNDPWVLGAVGAILLITSVLASALPAWRATQVNISKLLHSE